MSNFLSSNILNIPKAWRLRAYGSCEPDGFIPIAKKPAIESNLSAIDRAIPALVSGSISPANLGS